MTSRVRKVDRSLLDQSTVEIDLSSQFLDTDDQELFINRLTVENELQYKNSKKYLNLLILIEIPIILYYLNSNIFKVSLKRNTLSFLILSNLMTLMNSLNQTSKIRSILVARLLHLGLGPHSILVRLTKKILTPNGVNFLNVLINLQIYHLCYINWTKSAETGVFIIYLLFNFLSLFNLVMLVFINRWFKNISGDLQDLSNLKYKFKTV